MRLFILLCALTLLVMVAVVGLWPEGHVALTSDCEPEDKLASFRSSMQGRLFWRRQLRQIDDEMAWIKAQPEQRARLHAALEKLDRDTQAMTEDFDAKHPELRQYGTESESERSAEALRAQADAIEAAESERREDLMLARWLDQLQRCRPIVESRAR